MVPEQLEPHLEILRQEYVLVQAWKKTAAYIRYHNWFSDTLALDRAAVNLPAFLGEIRERLQSQEPWQNDPLRIVPAPKSQRWRVQQDRWEPVDKGTTSSKLRPLAHVSLADQVVATAVMLCLADRVETLQGDPRLPIRDPESRKRVVSYGNRLFCDAVDGGLRHRWGSAKLYRAYYQDYRTFLTRPEVAAESLPEVTGKRIYVSMPIFGSSMTGYGRGCSPKQSIVSARTTMIRLFFRWGSRSSTGVGMPATDKRSRSMRNRRALTTSNAWRCRKDWSLPAFFANVVLLSFDEALRAAIGSELAPGILLADASRYVDDMRILIAIDPDIGRLGD